MEEFVKFGEFNVKDRVARVGVDAAKQLISALQTRVEELHKKLPLEFVNKLPTENIDESKVYLVGLQDPTEGNRFLEYVYIDGQWELWGTVAIEFDVDEFVKKSELKSEKWEFTLEDGTVITKDVLIR